MEAMACGKPVIGTNWSGNTQFMTNENSYLLDYKLVPVPEAGWREIPTYRGHRWAEPDRDQLVEVMRRVVESREEREGKAALGQSDVAGYSREAIGARMAVELERIGFVE